MISLSTPDPRLLRKIDELRTTNEFLKLLKSRNCTDPAILRPFVQKQGETVRLLLRHPELIR